MEPILRLPFDDSHHITLGDDTSRGPNERRARRRPWIQAGIGLVVLVAIVLAWAWLS